MLSDHAAQNLRTTSIGLSVLLLLWSSFGEGRVCGFSASAAHTGHLQQSGSGRVQVRRRQGDQASPNSGDLTGDLREFRGPDATRSWFLDNPPGRLPVISTSFQPA
jgi:hypothetical protein